MRALHLRKMIPSMPRQAALPALPEDRHVVQQRCPTRTAHTGGAWTLLHHAVRLKAGANFGENAPMRRLHIPRSIRTVLRDPERAENIVLLACAVTTLTCLTSSLAAMAWLN
jgi:hypothetical protein